MTNVAPAAGATTIANYGANYTASGSSGGSVSFTPTGGGAAMNLALGLTGITQYGGSDTVQASSQNGYASGTLSGTTINSSGVIEGTFTNGQSKNLAQVCLSTFNNEGGLNSIGDNMFTQSDNSGLPQIGTAGTSSRGTIDAGTLEQSNVDLATQFSDLVTTERAFDANSKIVTTIDQMLQELANLKQG
jgi:flagellar hook protein FlgE